MVINGNCEVADSEFSYATFGQKISLHLMYFGSFVFTSNKSSSYLFVLLLFNASPSSAPQYNCGSYVIVGRALMFHVVVSALPGLSAIA
jgi:hypothetical protein